MNWKHVPSDIRAVLAFALTLSLFVLIFRFAPADDLRGLAIAFVCGAITAIVTWEHFSGWDLFCAGSAMALAGSTHCSWPQDWFIQAALGLPAVVAWYLGARLTEDTIVYPYGYSDKSGHIDWERLCREKRKGLLTSGTALILGLLILTPLAEIAAFLAFPATTVATYYIAVRWHIRRPLWPCLGWLLAWPLAAGIATLAAKQMQALPPYLADPWLVNGLLTLGTIIGLWIARWKLHNQLSPLSHDPSPVDAEENMFPPKSTRSDRC